MKLHEQIIFTIKSIRCNISNLMKSGYVILVGLPRGTNTVVMQCTTVQAPTLLHTQVEFRGSRTRGLAVSRKLCRKWREVRCKLAGMRQITEKQMESNGDLSGGKSASN